MSGLPPGFILDTPNRAPIAIPLPVGPRQQRQDARQAAIDERNARNEAVRLQIAQAEERRRAQEFAAKFNPDGTPKASAAEPGSYESKTREAQASDNSFVETALRNLGTSHAMNRIVPTGRFEARVNAGVQEFPGEWNNNQIAAFQTMNAMKMNLLKPAIALSAPANAGSMSKETDAAKELEMALDRVPRPENEEAANEIITNNLGQTMLDRLAQNTFMNVWREKNGSIYAKNSRGQDALSAWQAYKSNPVYQRTVARPFTEIMDERRARRTGQAPPRKSGAWWDNSRGIAPRRLTPEQQAALKKYGL